MGLLSEYFGEPQYLTLAEQRLRTATRPKTVSSTSQTRSVDKITIRNLCESDWFTFSTVNVVSNLFSKPKFDIVAETDDDKKVWENFFAQMRNYGNNTSLKRLRAEVKKDAVSYGAGYVEFVPSEDGDEILDLKRVDSSRMNKAKDNKGNIILDAKGNSIGYVLTLGSNADLRSKGDPIPTTYRNLVKMTTGDIFILPVRIAEFPLYRLGNGVDSIGMVEPAIQQAHRRQKIEDAQVNAIWIKGTAPLFATVGDATHEPNPQMLSDALDSLEEMKHSSVAAFPYFQEPKTLDAKVDDISTKIMDYLMAAEAGAANVPVPFVTGAGEATNRSTLKSQREMLEVNIQEKIDNFDEDWNLLVMERVGDFNKFPEAKIVSEELRLESKDETAKRLKVYADIGNTLGTPVMTPIEFRKAIKSNETIEMDDKEYEKFIKERQEMAEKLEQEKSKEVTDSNDNKQEDMSDIVTKE